MTEGRFLVSDELAAEWMTEYNKHTNLAGLFRGWAAKSFGVDGAARFLYVGKSTSGPFHEADVHSIAFDGKYAFWALGRRIAEAAGLHGELAKCIAWSNISKLARTDVAADPALLVGLSDLAVRTLESEISLINPEVVIFVSHHFSDEVVNRIAAAKSDTDWTRSEDETNKRIDDIWWKRRADGIRVLWMCHPERKSNEKLSYAADKVIQLRSEYRAELFPEDKSL